jgi:hypothetical protein
MRKRGVVHLMLISSVNSRRFTNNFKAYRLRHVKLVYTSISELSS